MGKQMSFLGLILGWMLVVASYHDGVPKLFSHFLSIVMGVATFVFVIEFDNIITRKIV